MASLNSQYLNQGNNFVAELSLVREKIEISFSDLINRLKRRKYKLLIQLDDILTAYHSYREELEKNNKGNDIEKDKINELSNTRTNDAQTKFSEVKTALKSVDSQKEPKMVRFVCDKSQILAEILKFGKFVEKDASYEKKAKSIASFGKRGSELEQLNYPWGLVVDKITGNIYVADQFNHSVKVYANSGEYLFRFGDSFGEGRMEFPKCMAIYEDRLLITHEILSLNSSNYNILNYQVSGKFISRIGSSGNGKLEFDSPCGIACNNLNGDIYVCDKINDRIQVLYKEFAFKSQFGVEKLKSPLDIKLSEEYIFILDEENPCIHLYNYDHILQKSIVSRGKGMLVEKPYCFCVDELSNILITDRSLNCILILNPDYELDLKIQTSQFPMGVGVDSQKRVIVVCRSRENCLQIF